MSAGAAPVIATATITRGKAETHAFTRALLDLVDLGLRPHCSDPGRHHLWLSEDVTERRIAARLCRGRPVIVQCGHAADARRERFGFGRRRAAPRGSPVLARAWLATRCVQRRGMTTNGQSLLIFQ